MGILSRKKAVRSQRRMIRWHWRWRDWLAKPLAEFNLEAVLVTVTKVFLALAYFHLDEGNVSAVTLHQIGTVIAIFVAVPIMIIAAVAIVIANFAAMIFGHCCLSEQSRKFLFSAK